jgi:hypothetical protein
MPRYMFLSAMVAGADLDAALRLTALRFPEVAVERHYTTHDNSCPSSLWLCQAPSEAHVRRWTSSAQLVPVALRRIDGENSLATSVMDRGGTALAELRQ